jgi:hypothetical protein
VEDIFRYGRRGAVQFAENVGLGRVYVTGWYSDDPAAARETVEPSAEERASVLTHEANYHPDGAQVFASRDGAPFVLLLAKPGDDVRAESFVAFYVDPALDGIVGVHVNAGVWHQPAFPSSGVDNITLDNRQGKVHACVGVDFVREFGCYLRVPLAAKAIVDSAQPLSLAEVGGAASLPRSIFRIFPKDLCGYEPAEHGPLFFLAGPLTGGDDWQSKMCEVLAAVIPTTFTVAFPYGSDDRPRSDGALFSSFSVLPAVTRTGRQLPWERYYLDMSAGVSPQKGVPPAVDGCIIFWLPGESQKYPKPSSSGPYAQDTRGELGEWRGRLMADHTLRVVVGADPEFPGLSTLERNFKLAVGESFQIHATMRDTALAAAAFCR